MLMKYLTMNSLLLALMFATLAFAFVPQRNVAFRASTFLQKTPEDFKSDFPPEESYEGDIDWDAEWKKVVSNKDQPRERPGKDFYKSDAEITAIKAANKASEKVAQVASGIPSVPSFDSVKNDWKFWVGILALVSVGVSLISASGQTQMASSGDSFYI